MATNDFALEAVHWDDFLGMSSAELSESISSTGYQCLTSTSPFQTFQSSTTSSPGTGSATTPAEFRTGTRPFHSSASSPSNGSTTTAAGLTANAVYQPYDPSSKTSDNKRKRDRERNTEAARRYRKRRVDETDELRAALAAMTKERDEMKLKLVRAEAEASLLRKMHVGSSSKVST